MRTAVPAGLIVAVVCGLYLPFLGSPLVFDDRGLYSGYLFSEHASSPFGLGLRHPAHFSFAFVEVLWGRIEAHRLVSLALHAGCGCALYALAREFHKGFVLPLAAAVWFVAHPVAVYGAGYLAQRSIVMATMFSLISILAVVQGLRRGGYAGAVVGALAYSAAVLAKEHAILVAAAAAAAIPLAAQAAGTPRRHALRYAAVFLAGCVPAALLVVALSRGIIGTAYEPQFAAVSAEVVAARGAAGALEHPWIGSALTQVALFFRYVALWLWPMTSGMSIDLRVDFAAIWMPAVAVAAVGGFLAWGALAAWLLARGGRGAAAGFGLLYVWLLYLVEFTTLRYQEPLVLYRSYLWAPGLAIALAAALAQLPRTVVAVLLGAAAAVLPAQAYDRLTTFSSGIALWEDAAKKLPEAPVPGGARTLYLLGREYLLASEPRKAVAAVERCMERYPASSDCQFARAAIHMYFEEYERAVPYLLRAIALEPKGGGARHHLGWTLENLGCIREARVQYRIAADLGYVGGAWRLMQLDSPGKGLIPPSTRPRGPCPPAIRNLVRPPA
ncbi:MAG TPA: tetratricopeptide repeat protein [Burkholderiales bacterium]